MKLKGVTKPKYLKKSVSFSKLKNVKLFEVVEGERKDMTPESTLEQREERRREVDAYKENEMKVHESSVGNTVIRRLTDWNRIDEENRRKAEESNRRLQERSDPDEAASAEEDGEFGDLGPAPDLGELQDFFTG